MNNAGAARDLLARGTERLALAGIDSARLDARLLLGHALGQDATALLSVHKVSLRQRETFEALIARRAAREPLSYITGTREFWSLDFEVGPGVLVPRPETETLVEEAFRAFPDLNAPYTVLDLGTGSGCILISALSNYGHARGVGVDASAEALAWARRNVGRHRLSQRCELRLGSWIEEAQCAFKLIFANPPYLSDSEAAVSPTEIRHFEPRSALAAGPDGLDCYRSLAPAIARRLAPDGLAFVEVGAGQAGAVAGIFAGESLEITRIASDMSGIPRCIVIGRGG